MIPVLYESTATSFSSCGLGELVDALSCVVTERRNGLCSLEMEYPTDGLHYEEIAIGRLIKAASAPGEYNIFCIQSIEYSMDGVAQIYAPQITCFRLMSARRFTEYDSTTWSPPEGATGDSIHDLFSVPPTALRGKIRPRLSEVLDEHGLVLVPGVRFSGDYSFPAETELYFEWKSKDMTAFEVIQTVAEALGGEIRWGFNRVEITHSRGSVTGLEIRYGVNMTKLDAETDGESYITAVMPTDSVDVDNDYVQAATPGVFPFFRIDVVEDANAAHLQDSAKLETAIKVQFDAEGNVNVAFDGDIWHLFLCDTVTVVHPALELRQTAKIVETVFDSLLERYDSQSVGDVLKDITDTIAELVGK